MFGSSDFTEEPGSQPSGTMGGGDWISTLIAAGAAVYNGAQNRKAQKEANQANKDAAELAYQREQEMWNKNNLYNNPLSQMQRFKDAGLNPNMIYGNGSAAAGNATNLPKYNAPTMQPVTAPIAGITEVLGMYQNFQMRQAQINNLKAQNENIETRTANEALRSPLLSLQGKRDAIKLSREDYLAPFQNSIIANEARGSEAKLQQEWQKVRNLSNQEQQQYLNMDLTRRNITGSEIANEKRQAELVFQQFKNQWMKDGVTSSDNPVLRIFTRMLGETGLISTFSQGLGQFNNKSRNDKTWDKYHKGSSGAQSTY